MSPIATGAMLSPEQSMLRMTERTDCNRSDSSNDGSACSPPTTTTSLTSTLLATLKQPKSNDIDLLGDDDVRVPACRLRLGCLSPVFRRMLYGRFAEASSSCIHLKGYGGANVLQELSNYSKHLRLEDPPEHPTAEHLGPVWQLLQLADAYDIPGLVQATHAYFGDSMKKNLACACWVWSLCQDDAEVAQVGDLKHTAWETISCQPEQALNEEGLAYLDATRFDTVLTRQREFSLLSDLFFLNIIETWRQVHQQQEDEDATTELCQELVSKHVDLTLVEPRELQRLRHLSILDPLKVADAFMQQALRASLRGVCFEPPQQITIEGAACPMINGVYHLAGHHHYDEHHTWSPKYSKNGQWKGELREFTCHRWSENEWHISIVPMDDDEPPNSSEAVFYSCQIPPGFDQLPPTQGWRAARKGKEPSPQITLGPSS